MIKQLRQKEQEDKIMEIEEEIKEQEIGNSVDKQINNKKVEKDLNDNDEKDLRNKSMNILSMRNNNINLNYLSNLNEIITSRKYLNEIYKKDKKIINHSFVSNSSTLPQTTSIKKVNMSYRNNTSLNRKLSKTLDYKNNQKAKYGNGQKKNKTKNYVEYGIYDPGSKSLRYRHYTDISRSYNSNIKFNNTYDEKENNSNKTPNNIKNISDNRLSNTNTNKNEIKNNKIKNNLYFKFEREILEKKEEVNRIYKNELRQKTNEINKIENELKEREIVNKQLINESMVDDKDFQKIILKNESLNNIYNEFENESLLKFREENLKKLEELRQKEKKFDKNKFTNIKKKEEEEKNADKQNNKKVNIMKYRTILTSAQQKIENNLELYNNELKINEQKKKALLNKLFGNNYKKDLTLENIEDINNNELHSGVNKYFIKNDVNQENNIFRYSSIRSNDETEKNSINENIVENFDFERKHHF